MNTTEYDKIQNQLVDLNNRLLKLEKLFTEKPPHLEKKISIKEFLLSKTAVDDIQKTLIVCYYLEKYEGLQMINVKDIEKGYRQAKEPVPMNINYKVTKNIQKGYLMEHDIKRESLKAWSLTNSGEQYIENNLK